MLTRSIPGGECTSQVPSSGTLLLLVYTSARGAALCTVRASSWAVASGSSPAGEDTTTNTRGSSCSFTVSNGPVSLTASSHPTVTAQIGRASCRDRGQMTGDAEACNTRTDTHGAHDHRR